jgi:hypothetical protein
LLGLAGRLTEAEVIARSLGVGGHRGQQPMLAGRGAG